MRKKNVPGRIVVHDRAQVESHVLPRYFNHASFASLRRQLNYFAFSREGKGKQKGATYTNQLVYDLNDILNLKRRLPGSSDPLVQKPTSVVKKNSVAPVSKQTALVTGEKSEKISSSRPGKSSSRRKNSRPKTTSKRVRKIIDSIVPVVHLPSKRTKRSSHSNDLKRDTTTTEPPTLPPADKYVSPGSSQVSSRKPSQIVLDLTKPENEECSTTSSAASSAPDWMYRPVTVKRDVYFNIPPQPKQIMKEDDVIAGCSALLSLGWQKS